MQETQEMQVQSLGWEDPLEEEMETNSSILDQKIPWTEEPGRATVHGVAKSQTRLSENPYEYRSYSYSAHNFRCYSECFNVSIQ